MQKQRGEAIGSEWKRQTLGTYAVITSCLTSYQPTKASQQTSYPSQSLNFLHRLHNPPAQNETPRQAKFPLKIIVSGAGLGGLATAIALRRRGHTVTVYERAPSLNEVGAGIQVPPNSSRLLLKWGINRYLHGKVNVPEAIRMRRWENGELIGLTRLGATFREEFGAPYWVVHRANLQIALYELAKDLGVNVKVGNGVKGYEEDTPRFQITPSKPNHFRLRPILSSYPPT